MRRSIAKGVAPLANRLHCPTLPEYLRQKERSSNNEKQGTNNHE